MAPVTEGPLWKKQKIMRSWKKKWFVLKEGSLHYFNDDSKAVLAGIKQIQGVSVVSGSNLEFYITDATGKISHLRADTPQARDKWVSSINAARGPVNISRMKKAGMSQNGESKDMMKQFDLLKSIGKGGFGRVLLVRKNCGRDNGNIYALKILSKDLVRRTQQVTSTRAEREILLEISHPFIVKLRYAFQNAEKLYMVMDYYPGGSMYFHLCHERYFRPHVVQFFASELVLALGHLHEKNILYRDMKLENILMDRDGHIAVTDFGLAKMGVSQDDATSMCGTPVYLAPEILLKKEYGKAVDYWALGTVLYELTTGRAPFQDRVREKMFQKIVYGTVKFPQGLTPKFQDLIMGLLNKDPNSRLGHGPQGSEHVKKHHYFQGVKWADILHKRVIPPFKPRNAGPGENVDKNAIGLEAVDSTVSGYRNSNFEDFTYVGESVAGGNRGSTQYK